MGVHRASHLLHFIMISEFLDLVCLPIGPSAFSVETMFQKFLGLV